MVSHFQGNILPVKPRSHLEESLRTPCQSAADPPHRKGEKAIEQRHSGDDDRKKLKEAMVTVP